MSSNDENNKRIKAFIAYALCVLIAIILFSVTKSGGDGKGGGGGGQGGGSGAGTGSGQGAGSGGDGTGNSDAAEGGSQPGGGSSEQKGGPEDPAPPAKDDGAKPPQEKSDPSGGGASSEPDDAKSSVPSDSIENIDMTSERTDVTEDQKKIWQAAVERTRKLCKYPEKAVFPEFGAKDTEISKQETSAEGIPFHTVSGFYLAPNKQGKAIKMSFQCKVYSFNGDYIVDLPVVR